MTGDKMATDWMGRSRPSVSREFLADAPLRRARLGGNNGYLVRVRLTSYRSLPLSCIESISLIVNGRQVDPKTLILVLGHDHYRLLELGELGSRWWFILDSADVFFPLEQDLNIGPVLVEGELVTVEPYMTAGRFSFTNTSRRSLNVEEPVSVTGAGQP